MTQALAASVCNTTAFQVALVQVISFAMTFYFSRRFKFSASAFQSWIERVDCQEAVKGCAATISLLFILNSKQQHAWVSDLALQLIAISMLLRSPARLKSFLEPVRIVLGPVFPLVTIAVAKLNPTSANIIAACAAVAAVTVFRPDNTETLNAIGLDMASKTRRIIHGALLLIALVLALSGAARTPTMVKASAGLGMVTVALAAVYYQGRYLRA